VPAIVFRSLDAGLVARIRQHGHALGAVDDRACVLALIEYAIGERLARATGGTAAAASLSSEGRRARASHAARVRWGTARASARDDPSDPRSA
jgi:hypothetical protein